MFDIDGDGGISLDDLVIAMQRLGDKRRDSIIEEDAEDMIREVDTDKDGIVDYKDFYKMMTS